MKVIILRKNIILIVLLLLILLIIATSIAAKKNLNVIKIFEPIYKGSEDEKKVAFVCNVVWGNEYLPDMLREFKKNDIKISFFFGGEWVSNNKELLLAINSDGHEIGNHGYNHLKHTQISKEKNIEEILKTEEIIRNVLGKKTDLFAPPYGDLDKKVIEAAESIDYKVIMWSIDTIDWNTKDYNKILERVNKRIHNGAIILMHPTESTVKALPLMISNLKSKGYSIVRVSELLKQ